MSKKVLATMLAATMLMGATASTVSAAGFTAPEGVDPSEYHLAICIHSMDNEYWAQEAKGAQLAAEYYGVEADILTCDSDDNKQIQGIKDYIAQYGDKAIFVVDPSSTANTVNIAETCEDAGVYVSILAHRAEGLYPADYPHFVASLMLDDMAIGKATASALFEAIGGEGQVAELQGLLGDDSATNRHAAFEEALKDYPDIEVVDSQTASWSQSDAMTLVENWIVNYPDLKGIMGTSSFDAPGVARAIQELGLVDKFFTSGTGMPADNAELLKSGVIKSLTLWDPAKSGEAMVDLACKVLAGEEIGAPVNLNVDGYTEMNFREGSETVLEGQGWITIDADTVDDFGF